MKTSKTLDNRNEYWGFYIKHLSKQERHKTSFEKFCKNLNNKKVLVGIFFNSFDRFIKQNFKKLCK